MYNVSCGPGFPDATATAWASHSGRGSARTSCDFAKSVLDAYWQHGEPTRAPRTISAPGSVPCTSVEGARCDGAKFIVECAAYGSDPWITCAGGSDAKVYLY
jgi:serine/threonine-protein kinase